MRILSLSLIVACMLPLAASAEILNANSATAIAGEYIVVLKDTAQTPAGQKVTGASEAALKAAYGNLASQYRATVMDEYSVIPGFSARMSAAAALALSKNPNVRWVEQNQVVTLHTVQNNPGWGLDRIDQRSTSLDNTYTYTSTASNIDVYIIDSGIRNTHEDFGNRVKPGFSAVSSGDGRYDCLGHGTHVAGIAGGDTYGTAKRVDLIPVRVFACSGSGTVNDIIQGINWIGARDPQLYDPYSSVVNMSLGSAASSSLDAAVQTIINQGFVVVVSAGNDAADACNLSPARVADAVTVAALNQNGDRADFSNYGSCVDIFAPGKDIRSAWYTSNTASKYLDGTSMAAPFVTGRAALLRSQPGTLSPAQVQEKITGYNATHIPIGPVGPTDVGTPNKLLYTLPGLDSPWIGVRFVGCINDMAMFHFNWTSDYGAESEYYNADLQRYGAWQNLSTGSAGGEYVSFYSWEHIAVRADYTISQGTSPKGTSGEFMAPYCGKPFPTK